MKNFQLIFFVLIAGLLISLTSCNELLEAPQPATSISGDQVVSSVDGVQSIRASMYSRMRASFGLSTQYFVGPSAIADETYHRPGASRFQGLNIVTGSDGELSGLSTYGAAYDLILDTNLMISGINEGVLDEATLNRYRGEAYAIRAFAMHNLARAISYEPGMAPVDFDLGIVLVTEPTTDISQVEPRARATVQETYAQILSDLENAKALLSGINSDVRYITEAYVDGLTARVNLYAGNWAAASAAAQNALDNSGIELQRTASDIANMFDETAGDHPEALFKIVVNPSTEPIAGSNTDSGPAAYTAEQWSAQLPTNAVIDQYEEDDYRLGWYAPCYDTFNDTPETECEAVNDEGWELQKFNAELGQLADNLPYMRISEIYLIKAEADAKAANSPAAGIEALQTLRQARNASEVSIGNFTSMNSFEDFILEERVRELVSEGHRWYDLKRLGRLVPNRFGEPKVRYDSYRILDNIGPGNISANPELIENPGY